jgi:hypothetical protein
MELELFKIANYPEERELSLNFEKLQIDEIMMECSLEYGYAESF